MDAGHDGHIRAIHIEKCSDQREKTERRLWRSPPKGIALGIILLKTIAAERPFAGDVLHRPVVIKR